MNGPFANNNDSIHMALCGHTNLWNICGGVRMCVFEYALCRVLEKVQKVRIGNQNRKPRWRSNFH